MIRVVVAEVGASAQSSTELAHAVRNAGMEAICTGANQAPEQVVRSALQEDADVIGVCGGTDEQIEDIRGRLAAEGAADIAVLTAGTHSPQALVKRIERHLAGE